MRVGLGFDIHRLVEGRELVLGGVKIPFSKGLMGHSDGDVVLHAVSDAILGAAGLPDIGELFPDSDLRFKNLDSKKILSEAVKLAKKTGFRVQSLDIVVICEEPKIIPYKNEIIGAIRTIIQESCHINLKGKTNEKIGEIGMGLAIACIAIALLEEIE